MQKTGHSYKLLSKIDEKFDAIVIGSGMGGLCIAALLAKEGKKILVLEQHYAVGGYTHVFKRDGYQWDVGLHYIGDVYDKNSIVRKVFDYITNGKLEWTAMDEKYDVAVFGDREFAFYKGKERCKSQLKKYFPSIKDHYSIDRYFDLLARVENVGMGYYVDKVLPSVLSKIIGSFLRQPLLKYTDRTTREVLEELTDNQELIGVLTAQYGDYGLPPAKSSFYIHAMVANHYMNGASYPVGGSSVISSTISSVIEGNGGMVLYSAEVKSILVEDNTAVGVKMKDDKIIYAPLIISDTGIKNTFLKLLDENTIRKYRLTENVECLSSSTAHVCLYIGFKKSAAQLQLPKCNYWVFSSNYNHDETQVAYQQQGDPIPVAYISFPSAKDPDWDKRYPGKSTIEIVTLVPYEWFDKWENTIWGKRGTEYTALKEQIAQQLLQKLFQIKPHLKGEIDYYELSTPLSTKTFTHNDFGEIYGLAHTPERFRNRILKPATPVKNLYLTGQDVFIAGVSGAMMGGVLCATSILKKNMLAKVKSKKHLA